MNVHSSHVAQNAPAIKLLVRNTDNYSGDKLYHTAAWRFFYVFTPCFSAGVIFFGMRIYDGK